MQPIDQQLQALNMDIACVVMNTVEIGDLKQKVIENHNTAIYTVYIVGQYKLLSLVYLHQKCLLITLVVKFLVIFRIRLKSGLSLLIKLLTDTIW
jgi:hypothetical protein